MSNAPGTAPPGWYADPSASQDRPGRRWWDGQRWTEHTAPPPAAPGAPATTPDGVPIATLGRRIGAYVIDGLVVGVIAVLLAGPFWVALAHRYVDYLDRTLDAAGTGAPAPSSWSLYIDNIGSLTATAAVQLVVTLVYHAVFLRWRAATPGKSLLGLRVRRLDTPEPLPWSTVARRLSAQFWYLVGALVPFAVVLVGLWAWVDDLWATGNPRRQALHDRFAGTVVVDTRS